MVLSLLALALAGWPSLALASATVTFRDGVSPSGYAGTKDVSISDGASIAWNPDTNYNGRDLEIDGDPEQSVALMQWDVSAIPAGSTVIAASITLDVDDSSSQSYSLYECLQPWVDTQATYNAYANGSPWGAPGANGSADRGTTALELDPLTGAVGSHTYRLNASGVAVVQNWVNNPSQNHGLVGVPFAGASDGLHWYSSKTATPSSRPKLTVSYTGSSGASVANFQNGVSPTAAYSGSTDTVIVSGPDPRTINGNGNGLGADASPDLIFAFIGFDLSSIPSWATVNSATLTLNVTNASAGTFSIEEVLKPWDETATWNEYRTGSAWSSPGALGATDHSPTVLATFQPGALGMLDIPLNAAGVATVQAWVSGSRANRGFILGNPTEADGVAMSDREDPTPANHPALTIDYTEGRLVLQLAAGPASGPLPVTVSRQRVDGSPIGFLAPALNVTLSTSSPTGGFSTNPIPGYPTTPTYNLQIPAGLPSSILPVYFFDPGSSSPTVTASAGPAWIGSSQTVTPVQTDGGTGSDGGTGADGGTGNNLDGGSTGPGAEVDLAVGCGAAGAMPAMGLLGLVLVAALGLRRRAR